MKQFPYWGPTRIRRHRTKFSHPGLVHPRHIDIVRNIQFPAPPPPRERSRLSIERPISECCKEIYWQFIVGLTRSTIKVMWLWRNIEALSRNHRCSGKAVSITYSECMSIALFIQRAMRVRHILLSSVACPDLQYFYTLSHKRHGFRNRYWT